MLEVRGGEEGVRGSNSRCSVRPGAPPVFNMFLSLLYDNRILRVFWKLLLWMMYIGQARQSLLGPLTLVSGFLTLVVGFRMWTSLYRRVLAWSREIAAQLRSASVGLAPACWDATPRCHAGVGDVILHGASSALPSFATPAFRQICRLGGVERVVQKSATKGRVRDQPCAVDGVEVCPEEDDVVVPVRGGCDGLSRLEPACHCSSWTARRRT